MTITIGQTLPPSWLDGAQCAVVAYSERPCDRNAGNHAVHAAVDYRGRVVDVFDEVQVVDYRREQRQSTRTPEERAFRAAKERQRLAWLSYADNVRPWLTAVPACEVPGRYGQPRTGTRAGWAAHQRAGQEPCRPCARQSSSRGLTRPPPAV